MIKYPYVLLLLFLYVIYFLFRNKVKYYFRHVYLDGLKTKSKFSFKWQYFVLIGSLFVLLGACNFVWKNKETTKSLMVHKYVLVNDGSGSMVDGSKENGIGKALIAVLSGNDKLFEFLGKRNDGSKDLVGAIVFADDAFVVSGFSDDPSFVQKKLRRIDYRLPPLSQGTDIESGLWAALEMILSDAVGKEDLLIIQKAFYGSGNTVKIDKALNDVIVKKKKFEGSSIIIFTDGIFNPNGNNRKMSSFKIIDFLRILGVRVYFISIFDLDKDLIKACIATGGRGDILADYDKSKLEIIYTDIVKSQATEYVIKEKSVDMSLATYLGMGGFIFIIIGILLHNTLQLNLTEV